MLRSAWFAIVPFSLFLTGCAVTSLEPTSFTPSYKLMEKTTPVVAAEPCAVLSNVVVEDARKNKELGIRSLEQSPGVTQPVSLKGDPSAWVHDGAEAMLQRAKISTGVAGKPVLRLKIDRLTLNENIYRLANYESNVDLTAEVVSSSGANACWSMRLVGAAENGGKPGSAENYEETVNRALDRAFLQLVYNSEFAAKLCGACSR